jgi:hypothetical protein
MTYTPVDINGSYKVSQKRKPKLKETGIYFGLTRPSSEVQ